MKNIVYFDLETQLSATEVGGWNNISKMLMSIGVTYSTATGAYEIYDEKRVEALIDELQKADLIVGFNHIRFDYEVLHHYTALDLRQLPSLDMLLELQKTMSHRLSLDSIATGTFGVQKTSDGLQALRWFREGRMRDIAEYCCFDVKITRMVHEYGLEKRQLHYMDRFGKKQSVPVQW
ncbi:MAG: helicase [Pedosphaera sp.]|nr:helicase [Pedosphaera sp.]